MTNINECETVNTLVLTRETIDVTQVHRRQFVMRYCTTDHKENRVCVCIIYTLYTHFMIMLGTVDLTKEKNIITSLSTDRALPPDSVLSIFCQFE